MLVRDIRTIIFEKVIMSLFMGLFYYLWYKSYQGYWGVEYSLAPLLVTYVIFKMTFYLNLNLKNEEDMRIARIKAYACICQAVAISIIFSLISIFC